MGQKSITPPAGFWLVDSPGLRRVHLMQTHGPAIGPMCLAKPSKEGVRSPDPWRLIPVFHPSGTTEARCPKCWEAAEKLTAARAAGEL